MLFFVWEVFEVYTINGWLQSLFFFFFCIKFPVWPSCSTVKVYWWWQHKLRQSFMQHPVCKCLLCVCVYTDYISVWVKVNERQAYAGGEQCVCLWNTSKLNLSLLIQLREFGQRHFTEHNSALQSHQNSARHTFRALKVPQRQTRWSKHFHLNNGCSNLNDLTGTSSLLTDASYYKEFDSHMGWAETIPSTEAQSFIHLFPWIYTFRPNLNLVFVRGHTI